jgi:hypothetical protein
LNLEGDAVNTTEKAITSSFQIKDRYNRSLSFADVASPLVRLGDYLRAKRSIEKSLDLAKNLGDEYFRAMAFKTIAETLPDLIPRNSEKIRPFIDKVKRDMYDAKAAGYDVMNAGLKVAGSEDAFSKGLLEESVDQALNGIDIIEHVTGKTTKIEPRLKQKVKKMQRKKVKKLPRRKR